MPVITSDGLQIAMALSDTIVWSAKLVFIGLLINGALNLIGRR